MGEIRVNDIIYGTSFASGVTCDDNETVQEKLSNAAYIDIENEEIGEIPRGDCLYTTDIIDNLESESDTHVLSAKQGKILNEKIENGLHDVVDNLESTATDKALSANQGRVLNEKIENFDLSEFGLDMELTQAEYDELLESEEGIDPQVTYFITDSDIAPQINFNKNLADFFSISKDYVIGDYCIFNNQLYEFIENKEAGDWDENKVVTALIIEKLKTCFQYANNGKKFIVDALIGKGIEASTDYSFKELATLITEQYSTSQTITYIVDNDTIYTENRLKDTDITIPETFVPSKPGYTFAGWRSDNSADGDVIDSLIVGTNDITIYAVFKKAITVSYNGNNSTGGSTASHTEYIYYNNGNTVNPTIRLASNGFTRTNGTFYRWAVGSRTGTQYTENGSVTLLEDTTFYAVWSLKQTGSLTLDCFANKTDTETRTFTYSYIAVPTVTQNLSYKQHQSHVTSVKATSITTTSITYKMTGDGDSSQGITVVVSWTAIGYA